MAETAIFLSFTDSHLLPQQRNADFVGNGIFLAEKTAVSSLLYKYGWPVTKSWSMRFNDSFCSCTLGTQKRRGFKSTSICHFVFPLSYCLKSKWDDENPGCHLVSARLGALRIEPQDAEHIYRNKQEINNTVELA